MSAFRISAHHCWLSLPPHCPSVTINFGIVLIIHLSWSRNKLGPLWINFSVRKCNLSIGYGH